MSNHIENSVYIGQIKVSYGVWFSFAASIIAVLCSLMSVFLISSPWIFALIVVLIYISRPPTYFISPRNIITAFYFLWYGVGVIIGTDRYGDMSFETIPEVYAYIMVTLGFFCWYSGAVLGEERSHKNSRQKVELCNSSPYLSSTLVFLVLYGSTLICAILYVQASGGISTWLADAGQAFLRRQGSGVYVIAFYTFFHTAALIAGYKAAFEKKYTFLFITLVSTILLVPLLGGKGRVAFQIFLLFGCYIFNKKTNAKLVLSFISIIVFSFAVITFFRSGNGSVSVVAGVAQNYFDTFQALVMLLRDFRPGDKLTILMPFNKFSSIIGQKEGVFYDMSLWLTSIYFPTIAKFRATVQWPIEADIYLSFGFFPGLPLIFGFGYFAGRLFALALNTKQCGFVFIALNLIMILPSHIRGGVLYWTDFWLIPTLTFSYLVLRPYVMKPVNSGILLNK